MSKDSKIRVAITQGDINGIGTEVIMKALADERICEFCTPVVFGSSRLFSYYRDRVTVENFMYNRINDTAEIRDGAVNILNVVQEEIPVQPGCETEASGRASLRFLQSAVEALKAGEVDVLVTAPICKHAMQLTGEFPYAGHTEYLEAELTEEKGHALMILYSSDMRVALVTTHVPLSDVPALITEERVYDYISRFNASLKQDFGIDCPQIAVLSLNPHASDGGMIGVEEKSAILPAIQKAFAEGVFAFGPYAADGLFGSGKYSKFDGILAMYHDQGLIPMKLSAGVSGVNFTAGLPYVRTSPDHGTGYDITGKDMADAQSMRDAIYAAIDIYRQRETEERIHRNPLRKQYVDRSGDRVTIDMSKQEENGQI